VGGEDEDSRGGGYGQTSIPEGGEKTRFPDLLFPFSLRRRKKGGEEDSGKAVLIRIWIGKRDSKSAADWAQ